MYMKKFSFLFPLLLLFVLISGCRKEEEEEVTIETAHLFVNVKLYDDFIEGAQIRTIPNTIDSVYTDNSGSVLITDAPLGNFTVYASHPSMGSGSAPATITEGNTSTLTITLTPGVFFGPSINIIQPTDQAILKSGFPHTFSAKIGHDSLALDQMAIEWRSSLEGVLSTASANASGDISFETNNLSSGIHLITLRVSDQNGYVLFEQIEIEVKELPDAIVLEPIQNTPDGLILNWSISEEEDFSHYKIMRSGNYSSTIELLDTIKNQSQNTYQDLSLSFNTSYNYHLVVVNNNGAASPPSNTETALFEGEYIDIGQVEIDQLMIDDTRPYIYVLDELNQSLLFINTNTKTVEKSISIDQEPPYTVDLNRDFTHLYISNGQVHEILVVDLSTQEMAAPFSLEGIEVPFIDQLANQIICMNGDRLVYRKPGGKLVTLDAVNGDYLSTSAFSNSETLYATPDDTEIIYTTKLSFSNDVEKYALFDDVWVKVEEAELEEDLNSTSVASSFVNKNNDFLFFYHFKYPWNDMGTVLGSFDENVYASNADGSIAVGEEYIWNANTFTIRRPMPLNTNILAFDNDDTRLYAYDEDTHYIYIINVN